MAGIIRASSLAMSMLRLPDGRPWGFDQREWQKRCLDDPARTKVYMAGRQVGKTSKIAAKLALLALSPFHSALYVAPRERQAQDFSKDKLAKVIASPRYKRHMSSGVMPGYILSDIDQVNAVLDKVFRNGSHIKLRYAFRSADHIRGITAKTICFDECQDLMTDHIWVILECQSSFPYNQKRTFYAGTPKTFETPLQERWDSSTQHEWMIRCGCGKWQFILRENIAVDTQCLGGPGCIGHVICSDCGRVLDLTNARWISTGNSESDIVGFRMPQMLNPVCDWHGENGIISKAHRMSEQLFANEVLALPHDAANRVFELQQLESLCNHNLSMSSYRTAPESIDVFAGIDWAEGGVSKTVLGIGAWMSDGHWKQYYAKMYDNRDMESDLNDIVNTVGRWGCRVVGADMGAGRYRNKMLIKALGNRTMVVQYHYPGAMGDQTAKVRFDRKSGIVRLNRHKTLDDVVMGVKRGEVEFPRVEQFGPFLKHLEYVREDWNSKTRQLYYDHPGSRPDDFFHVLNYSQIAGRLWRNEVHEAA